MRIINAKVFREKGFADGEVELNGGILAKSCDGEVLDAAGRYVIPGLIDVHLHGCMGEDFSTSAAAGIRRMARYEAENGVTALCPTTMTLPEDALAAACKRLTRTGGGEGAELLGVNLEGPFVSPQRLGAQNPNFVARPQAELFRRLQAAAGGKVRLLAVAPEVEGALDLIAELRGEVVCSIAHTTADYDLAVAAFARGARHVTHLYNAMPPFSHRAPGVIGAALDTPDCRVELIADGMHIHPSVVRATLRMFGDDRVVFVSDSMMATGLADGEYDLGGQAVIVQGNTTRLARDGAIAGSVTNLMDCVRTAVREMDIPLHTAVKCASVNPAKAVGVYGERGDLQPGKVADLVLLNPDLSLHCVILRGRVLD